VTTEEREEGEWTEVVDSVVRPTGVEPVTPRSVVPNSEVATDDDLKR
jgi:hypothetical protein